MSLQIDYVPNEERGRIARDASLPDAAWNRLRDFVIGAQPDALLGVSSIEADWTSVLEIVPSIAALRKQFDFATDYNEEARERLKRFAEERKSLIAGPTPVLAENEIEDKLLGLGYQRYDGHLKPEQLSNICALISLRNGANFSVPGAGKTTVALAVHMLTQPLDAHLLVVAPKNAFAAWDTVLDECIVSEKRSSWQMTRLVGGSSQIQQLLALNPRRAIISYEQLVRVERLVARFLARQRVHLILDESHRIKAGERTQRGLTLVRLAHLPVRRDILSGTPMPRSLDDIGPQMDFLWPGQALGARVRSAENPNAVLRPFYVRTTKSQLGLRRPERAFVPVKMSNPQVALYSLIKDEVLQKARGIRDGGNIDLVAAKRSIVRLMQASSNPILIVKKLTDGANEAFHHDDSTLRAIFEAILLEEDSPKLLYAAAMARKFANVRRKSVIWTSFTYNVERLQFLLKDIGALFIHGGVNAGDQADMDTREGRVKQFHDDPTAMVLVANPAACSEGISLHKVCHDAIYLDRSYNAGHYLQSVDRIHRLGLAPTIETRIHVLESVTPAVIGAIDYSIRRRTIQKLRTMSAALDDKDLQQLAIDEEDAAVPIDFDMELEDVSDIIDELTGMAAAPGEDEEL